MRVDEKVVAAPGIPSDSFESTAADVQSVRQKVQPGGTQLQSPTDIVDRVGWTPLLELKKFAREIAPVQILAKAEWFNPGGSVKDRAALSMILDGERSGRLTRGKTILDATSGNTGIAYAMFAAARGYPVKLCVPANAGESFRRILRAYGAELVLTDPALGSDGAIQAAKREYNKSPERYFFPDQYNNPCNWQAHYLGTGVEIIEQTHGEVSHFVAGLGTSGTFVGTGRRLKKFNPRIQLVAVQPDSPFHGLEGLKHMETAIVPGIYDADLADENVAVGTEEAQAMVSRLARTEGWLVGLSSGAALVAAVELAHRLRSGRIVVILPDSAHKYFDQRFWEENDGN